MKIALGDGNNEDQNQLHHVRAREQEDERKRIEARDDSEAIQTNCKMIARISAIGAPVASAIVLHVFSIGLSCSRCSALTSSTSG